MEREARRLEGLGQLGFDFRSTEAEPDLAQDQANEADLFLEPEPRGLFVGSQRLNDYLREAGLGWVLKLAALLAELDLSALTCRYQLSGRKAFHPRTLLGLIVYGILNRQWSLRELEALARRDVGAWWLCGGHQPDHSTVGKFIQLHAEVLTEEFFVALVKHLIVRLKLMPGVVAGDGTVVDAAASSYRLLRAEAMLQAAEETKARLAAEPDNWRLRRKAEAARRAAEMASGRAARRLARREAASAVKISPVEPEAVYQSVKGRRPRLCYKPLTLVSEYGLIVAQRVEPSSEIAAVEPMLRQHAAIFACSPPTLLLDAGFASNALWSGLVEAGIDLLCPSGRITDQGDWQKRSSRPGKFAKGVFRYVPERDAYLCPSGRELRYLQVGNDGQGRHYREYRGRQCGDCPLRGQCTDSPRGREVKRYDDEEIRELMAELLKHPAARAKYRRRKTIVEPCFAELKERQGLQRFRRRGMRAVRAEFALHCIAFNLKKAVRHSPASIIYLFIPVGSVSPSLSPSNPCRVAAAA